MHHRTGLGAFFLGLWTALVVSSGVQTAAAEPIAGLAESFAKQILFYDLEPRGFPFGERKAYEYVLLSRSLGPSTIVFQSRYTTPEIKPEVLRGFQTVWFYNGCGGELAPVAPAEAHLSSAELSTIRDYFFHGGNLVLSVDDAAGDFLTGVGSCQVRVNQIAENLGVKFSGTGFNIGGNGDPADNPLSLYCWETKSTHPLFVGGRRVVRFTPAQNIELLPSRPWGAAPPAIIASIEDDLGVLRPAYAFVEARATHGAVMFSSNFSSLSDVCSPGTLRKLFTYLKFFPE